MPKGKAIVFPGSQQRVLQFSTFLYFELVYFNFKQHQISPAVYLPEWLATGFLDHLPFDLCARIWDVVALEGDSFLFRVAIGILATLAGRLYFPDRQELLDVLRSAITISSPGKTTP
jgi:hypothetical protein